jgi:hypothetical protein
MRLEAKLQSPVWETKQKLDRLWIGSLILVVISALGLAYIYWAAG